MARTDTLGNFLTDVADAIRTKAGTSEPIQASTFDTAIANIPSGGGTPTPTSLSSFTEILSEVLNNFNTYLDELPTTYSTYTNNPITLYTPNADYKYYFIQKRAGNKYRAVWLANNNFIFQTGGGTIINQNIWSINLSGTNLSQLIQSGTNAILTNESNQYFYYSGDCSTLQECIDKLLANELTYTYYQGQLGAVADSPYIVPYTNAVVFTVTVASDKNGVLVEAQRLSQNETITTI